MPAFLLEIGLEEIPAGMIPAAQAELAQHVQKLLTRERLASGELLVKSYSTPRRLAVLVNGLLSKQGDIEEQLVGPSTAVAYKNGAPTPAAIAFAKKSGVEVTALQFIQNAKGEYVAATVYRAGRSAGEVLTSLLPAEIAAIYWPKNMYWRAGKPERFVRPVRWQLALLDEEVLPLEFAGVTADGASYGHRVLHGEAPVVIRTPHEYAEKLAAAYVQVDPEVRKHRIRKALDAAKRTIPGARWREDEKLIDVVTNLTEWPSVILGSFETSYLDLPEEVLVTVMRDHQKYFALEDSNGKLLPNFLTVLNIEVDEAGAAIIRHGNERVLRARFNDARFFWDVDQKIPLVDRVEMLKNVTFHKDLGSYWDKTERNKALAEDILEKRTQRLSKDDATFVSELKPDILAAAAFAKADLTTELVKEFTELQGVVGGLYAEKQGHSSRVAAAIADHYRPTTKHDPIPRNVAGSVISLADKIDTIVRMFALGLGPTGSKDPFALRRAGNGVVRILSEDEFLRIRLNLQDACVGLFDTLQITSLVGDARVRQIIYRFFLDRFESYLHDSKNVHPLVARAVRNASTMDDLEDFTPRLRGLGQVADFAEVLNEQVGSPQVLAVAELLKRAANIQRQAREKGIQFPGAETPGLLQEPAEKELAKQVSAVSDAVQKGYREGKYDEVIAAIASLQQPLNAFFDSVMVMVDDERLRDNRLALLARTVSVVRWAADFSELASIQE